jgi:hypothetical protein
MGRYSYRTKETRNADAAGIAIDAILAGRMPEAWTILANEHSWLTKPEAKKVAKLLVSAGRTDDALAVLTRVMGKDAAAEELKPTPTANVGDILVSSWGYDQTNVDYYQVIATSGSMATIREIQGQIVQSDRGSDRVSAVKDAFTSEPRRVRVQKSYGGTYCVKVDAHSDRHARPWDGTPQYQTGAGYGH